MAYNQEVDPGQHIVIDGNNLLYAMRALSSRPVIGRETLVRVIERWAAGRQGEVTVVLDGPRPRGGIGDQYRSRESTVLFSGTTTADEVIADQIARTPGASLLVITSDKALGHLARFHHCGHMTAGAFVELLEANIAGGAGPPDGVRHSKPRNPDHQIPEKPTKQSPEETKQWLSAFGFEGDNDEPDMGDRENFGDYGLF